MRLFLSVLFVLVCALSPAQAQAPLKVKMGQAVPTLGFLPLYAARATDAFAADKIDAEFASIPGGDPTTLAALDAGDIDFAAVGAETALLAVSKGAPYQMVYSLMSKMSVDLVVSNAFLKRTGVSPSDPLPKRLAALKGATIGTSAVRGAQERIAKWLAAQGGLTPDQDLQLPQVGPPPALRAAMENGRIDGFVLTAPEGQLVERAGFGKVLVRPGSEIEELKTYHHLVLVIRKDTAEKKPEMVTRVVAVLDKAAQRTVKDTAAVAKTIQQKFYEKVPEPVILDAVESLKDGVDKHGRMSVASIDYLLKFSNATGAGLEKRLDAAKGEGDFWSNRFIDQAVK
jgi:ABC-type nitrate/sulfonate/bicarbonate transport system substrate-binding protein